MRNISFSLTTKQVRHGFDTGEILKDVTRRLGWGFLYAGDRLMACEKCQGIRKGGLVRLGIIEVVSVRVEPLHVMRDDWNYGVNECIREGFPEMRPEEFVAFFCKSHKGCLPTTPVNRIEFRYVEKFSKTAGPEVQRLPL